MKQRMGKFFNGQNGAVSGAMAASFGMAIGSVVEAVLNIENLWIWGFSIGFGVGMLIYAIISHFAQAKEEV